jgi:hypothetical protein
MRTSAQTILQASLAILALLCASPLHAQSSQIFPPMGCVAGQTNLLTWQGVGTPTRCTQVPVCQGTDSRLQFSGQAFTCVCDGTDCGGNPPPTPGSCSPQQVTWQVGNASCTGFIPFQASSSQFVTLQNNSTQVQGNASYICRADPGVSPHWELMAGYTCSVNTQTTNRPCPAQDVSWQGNGLTCYGRIPSQGLNGWTAQLTQYSSTTRGTSHYTCVSPACTSDADCAAHPAAWRLDSSNCMPY